MTAAGNLQPLDAVTEQALLSQLSRKYGWLETPSMRRQVGLALAAACRESPLGPGELVRQASCGDAEALRAIFEPAAVSETYLWRHPEQLEAAVEAARSQGPLRVWCAGCATGEEPLSYLIAARERGLTGVEVLATDASRRSLERARLGRYGQWSFRAFPAHLRRYFQEQPDATVPSPALRAAVRYAEHNLAQDPAPLADADVVSCRNVLLYFHPQAVGRALEVLISALRPGGILVVGASEAPLLNGLRMEALEGRTSGLFRRRPMAAAPPSGSSVAARPERAPAATPRAVPTPPPSPAVEVAPAALGPETWWMAAMAAEQRGDLTEALEAARRAVYLDPTLPFSHALQSWIYARAARTEDAARARRRALEMLTDSPDGEAVRSTSTLTAGALRRALSGDTR